MSKAPLSRMHSRRGIPMEKAAVSISDRHRRAMLKIHVPAFRHPAIWQNGHDYNYRPCRWYARSPLGQVPGRAYRLIERSADRADFPGLALKGLVFTCLLLPAYP